MTKCNSNLILLVDTIKDSRDLAKLIQLSLATNVLVYLTGDSLSYSNFKVLNILNSYSLDFPDEIKFNHIKYENDYFKTIENLKKEGYLVVGTSPSSKKSLFSKNYSSEKVVLVFGTEHGGLSKKKMSVLDDLVLIPMFNQIPFFTLETVMPIATYEILRQKELV
ncbi:MAG: TrmH family RNA methyltransferase [Candidatus ainarchaeum sp.]|nr:TrmH family RNA methyltransferase [Candidatus ainarchaeum sp.]